ncbi:aminotransferase class I/II-fold pyridoxal phosphate-dependent enzyme [Rhodoferax sp. U11-2br]|uniref:aminotransferase class I/II-fold pyridoxal phosphate-dependent enzyme n=1 Tax=Rhodoferax sp. U11-2br TaxID=2838878 RepID=UPI001BEB78C7|nr:aminotransferase class I/II-fold pyridoxal phosphate-dependent enzyme [Rhodoferax sp. U11-2br]MBT3066140.1 aminotransferase class I/II-fold pyridoxal phosphate-dependent enzyme [Rhodoferax sp. U11-2br]
MTHIPHSSWTHGGADALGAARFDFSTNSNACGPCPQALAAVQAADASHYPDPAYTTLRQSLAAFHGVAPERVLLASSASEAIFRLTAWAKQQGVGSVCLPDHHYGDYARAAQAWGLLHRDDPTDALCWACEPSSPLGQSHEPWFLDTARFTVLDRAYAPLRLSGEASLNAAQLDQVWQLFTPNKALGLTGVRAAYLIAPSPFETRDGGQKDLDFERLKLMAPSWVLGAHGVALLQSWVSPEVQAWLADSLTCLRDWKARQIDLLQQLGWQVAPSEANYFCARPPVPMDLATLRQHGIKLRDATSFGLPGWYRLGVLAPQAQDALVAALTNTTTTILETST